MTPQVIAGRAAPRPALGEVFPPADLGHAISTGQVTLHYQPQVELTTGLVLGVEALARWEHPRLGLLGPDQFLPQVARADLMHQMTLHVLDRAMEQAAALAAAGHGTRVSVNVAASDLHGPGFVDHVADTLDRYQLDRALLGLEVTETEAMTDPERSGKVLCELHQMGIHLSVDDYGTGHSCLAYLQQFPFRSLKLDRAFIAGLLGDPGTAAIVRSTIAMARELGMPVLAEGVEDDATLLALRGLSASPLKASAWPVPFPLGSSSQLSAGRRRGSSRSCVPPHRRSGPCHGRPDPHICTP